MKQEAVSLQTRLYQIAVFILVSGLISAVLIYFIAEDVPDDVLTYQTEGGNVSTLSPEDSKRYMREMEQFGGRANVLAYKFGIWFGGLWHGKSLAFTVGGLSIILAYGFRFVADRMPSGPDRADSDGKEETGTDKKS
jgi:hypothetical protein